VPQRTFGRLTSRSVFAELQRSRARASSGPVRASFVPADDGAPGVFPQVGYAIGRHCGTAVTRNTLRRRAREVARAEAATLPRGFYLVRVAPGAAAQPTAAFRSDVATALRRAGQVPAVTP
jgi:ribonuclease P protein component